MSNYQNSAGTDLDNLFYTSNSNAGSLGYLDTNSVDLGNKYNNSATLGYGVGYLNSGGTDLGYLRGGEPTTPTLTNHAITKIGIYRGKDPDGDTCYSGETSYKCTYYGPIACYYRVQATISNYVSTHSYTLYIGNACWTTSQSYPCNLVYWNVSSSLTVAQVLFSPGGTKNNLPSNNGGQCGNSHASDGTASDTGTGGARYTYLTTSCSKTINLYNVIYSPAEVIFSDWKRFAVKAYVKDNTKGTTASIGEANYWTGWDQDYSY